MILEGCQGKKGPQILEKTCPRCGATVELLSTDLSVQCGNCGETVYSDLMDCSQRCPKARECLGEKAYERMAAARDAWRRERLRLQESDEW